jgi:hypothetical protein
VGVNPRTLDAKQQLSRAAARRHDNESNGDFRVAAAARLSEFATECLPEEQAPSVVTESAWGVLKS